MKHKSNISYWLRNLRLKHRLSLRNEHDQDEVWYMHISPLSLVGAFIALVLLLFIVILTTVAYTPILDFIPGYPGSRSREMLVNNIMRLDSLERRLNSMQMYADNMSLIMEGKTPVVRSVKGEGPDSVGSGAKALVFRSGADSILRSQMEGKGPYSLSAAAANAAAQSALLAPLKGVVATDFSPKDGRFGVGIAVLAAEQVVAVKDGTVTLSLWSPPEGYIVELQHQGNMVSVYRHLGAVLPQVGTRVKAGDVLGTTAQPSKDDASKGYFGFELWINGAPVDPAAYIVF